MSRHDAPHSGGSRWSPVAMVRRGLRTRRPTARGHSDHRRGGVRHTAFGPGAALLVLTGFIGGSVVGVTLDQLERDAARVVQVAAAEAAQAHGVRLDTAATERLSGQATAYVARRRTEALDVAQTAVAEAASLRASVSPVVGTDALAPLDEAVTALSALLGSAPTAPTALETATAMVAAQIPVPEPTVAAVAPTTPGADVLSLVAKARGQNGPAVEPTTMRTASVAPTAVRTPPAAPRATGVTAIAPPAVTAIAPPAVTAVAGPSPEMASFAAAVPVESSIATGPATVGPTVTVPAPEPAEGPLPLDGLFARAVALAPILPAADVAAAAAGGLDVAVSNQILGLVGQIRALSVQVQASADAVVAEQRAAAEAEAAAEAAAQAAAARAARTMRTRIAATDAAPNGDIPTVLLCGVSSSSNVLLRCDAAAMLDQMDAAYREASGRHLVISSSYRTTAAQDLLRAAKGELAALAGTSNHGRAQAIDIAGAGDLGHFDAPVYLWLVANAGTYGWHHPSYMEPGGAGPLEPWHWEFGTA